jgi:hypothetical protein
MILLVEINKVFCVVGENYKMNDKILYFYKITINQYHLATFYKNLLYGTPIFLFSSKRKNLL